MTTESEEGGTAIDAMTDFHVRAAAAVKAIADEQAVFDGHRDALEESAANLVTLQSALSVIEAEAAASGISVAELHAAIKD